VTPKPKQANGSGKHNQVISLPQGYAHREPQNANHDKDQFSSRKYPKFVSRISRDLEKSRFCSGGILFSDWACSDRIPCDALAILRRLGRAACHNFLNSRPTMSLIHSSSTTPELSFAKRWGQHRRWLFEKFQPQISAISVFAAACVTILLFALTPATTRFATLQMDGLTIGIMRTVGAGAIVLPLLLLLRLRPPQKAGDWCSLVVSAFGSFVAFPILFSLGTQRTSGSHASLIMAAMPLLVTCAGMLFERRLPRVIWLIGAAIAVAGEIALVVFRTNGSPSSATSAGDTFVLAGCILFALGVVAGARLSRRISPLAATLWAITIASIMLTPMAVIHLFTTPIKYQGFTTTTWAAVLHLTLGASVVANLSWLWALSRGGLLRVAPIQFAQPVCALFFSSMLLGEHLNIQLLFIAVVVMIGTITACHGARQATVDGSSATQCNNYSEDRISKLLAEMG
jgi:drug/metabolite transporter (DMT)-like permease